MCVCGGEKVSGCNQQQQKLDVSRRSRRRSRRRSSQARAQLYSVSQPVGIRRPTQVSNLPFWLQAGFPFNNKIVLAKLAQIILTNTPSEKGEVYLATGIFVGKDGFLFSNRVSSTLKPTTRSSPLSKLLGRTTIWRYCYCC